MSPKAKALAKEKMELWESQMSDPVEIPNGYKFRNVQFSSQYYLVEIDDHLVLLTDVFRLVNKWLVL